ncbi:hypothetical protein HGRIS_014763 [Hohenbuehelia grisea]|uniref:Uncharacterized protein n=1 Tax=Hohenbuehelia grisea TaxID=104357 RepID=A0ABR3IQP8_9AGAR
MNRRIGIENIQGIGGGGMVTEESQRNLDIAEDLCKKRRPNDAVPYLEKALRDPNNTDALIQAAFLAPTMAAGLEPLIVAEKRGRALLQRKLSPDCFEDGSDQCGRFWEIVKTRPYMRVLQALVRFYFETGRYTDCSNTIIEMLRLCPGDNLAQRTWLGSLLLLINRPADALFFSQIWLTGSARGGAIPTRGGTAFPSTPPEKKLFDSEEERGADMMDGTHLYTMALAAFKLWGDSAEACQFLSMAARANPHILIRILGKVTRPTSLNGQPRQMNGPEEAHDYLWLAQDLWEEPDVWVWANSTDAAKASVLKTCSGCGVKEASATQFKRCSACRKVLFAFIFSGT